MSNKPLLFLLLPFFLTLFITPLIIRFAKKYGCVDKPGKRKLHPTTTPVWGGTAFFIGILPIFFILVMSRELVSYLIASFILVILGAIDDLKHLGWRQKLIGIVFTTSIVIFGGGVQLNNLGFYGSLGKIELGIISIPFTYFCIIGMTNAINLIDGLNGLAGGTSLIAFLFLGVAAYFSGNYVVVAIAFAFVGALGGFLYYNFPKAKIFMGDAGSLLLGFSLAVVSILLTQDEKFHIEPMFPILVLLFPIFDALRVMLLRLFKLKNPFKADKTHLHYLMTRRGVSSVKTVLFFWLLTIMFGIIATLIVNRTSTPYVIIALFISLILSIFANSIIKRVK